MHWFAQHILKDTCPFLKSNCWFPPSGTLSKEEVRMFLKGDLSLPGKKGVWGNMHFCKISFIQSLQICCLKWQLLSVQDSKTIRTIIFLVTTMNFVRVTEIFLQWILYCEWDFLSMARTCHSWARNKHCYCPKLSQKTLKTTQQRLKWNTALVL